MVTYKVDAYYAPAADRALLWKDPALGIAWPVAEAQAIVSDKDAAAPDLAACMNVFHSAAQEHPHAVCH
ncbi:MAG: dTDP-4-dehydrorhamnose 3 5-epimerase [Rhodospirillaceae bacterium]|nr:MAG: dTDP-4-dehydrorhamnose 3 5-epimerase [Rhodospirillaceae bacterium]